MPRILLFWFVAGLAACANEHRLTDAGAGARGGGDADGDADVDADGNGSVEPDPATVRARYCATSCDRAARCDGSAPPACESECAAELTIHASDVRADYLEALATCLAGADCELGEDTCREAALAIPVTAAVSAVVDGCLAKSEDCEDEIGDDACRFLAALEPEAALAADDCLALACDDADDCLETRGAADDDHDDDD